MKTQTIRLIDIFAIGPMMIWFSNSKDYPEIAKGFMLAAGIATILYNGMNYLEIQKTGEIK